MENLDLAVLRSLAVWIADGHRTLLATVVRTWGSSPRPVGSIMALRDDGRVVGSVSGGCIEDDLIDRHASALAALGDAVPPPQVVRYGVTADEAHRFGLPCGGTLELVLEWCPDGRELAAIVARLEAGQLVRRELDMDSGRCGSAPAGAPAELQFDGARLSCTFGPAYRMLLIGTGQVADTLAPLAIACGFDVTLCDPRESYAPVPVAAGMRTTRAMPDDAVVAFAPDRRSCVVALSHDPKLDDLALLEALDSAAFYVGAIGSRRNNESRRARLIEHFGQTEASLARLRGPIGVYVGSKTPPEIAVSVMAEILAAKNGVRLPASADVANAKARLEAAEALAP